MAEDCDFVFGPYSSEVTLAIAPILEKQEMPQISGSAEADDILDHNFEWTFGVLLGNLENVEAPLEALQRIRPDLRKAAIIQAGEDVFAKCITRAFHQAADGLGFQTQKHTISSNDPFSLVSVIRKIKRSGLEALIVGGHVDTLIDIVQVSKTLQYIPEAYVMHYGVASHDFISALGEDGRSVLGLSHWSPWSDDAGPVFGKSREFSELFVATYDRQPDQIEAGCAAAGSVFEQTVGLTGFVPPLAQSEKKTIKSVLREDSFPTFFGEIRFSTSNSDSGGDSNR